MTDKLIKNKDKQEEQESPEEEVLFTSLRAGAWDEFFGQEGVKQALHIAISAAKKTHTSLWSSGSW